MQKKANYSYVGIALIVLIFGIIFIPRIVDRVSNDDITREESRSKNVTNSNSESLGYLVINGEKKKVPSFQFIDQNGKMISDEDYLGKVYLVEFFFSTCPTICPLMNKNLVAIQNELADFENFGIASFTINPEVDTQEVLKDYAERYGVTNPDWHFMTGDKELIMNLTNKGFNLYAAEVEGVPGGFEHSGNFALIDKKGYIRSRLENGNPIIYYNGIISESEGVNDEGQPEQISILKEDIKKLLNE
ncbi:MAG: SCO family protein [bacterium]